MTVFRFILVRAALAVATIWLVSVAIFVATEVVPRDPAIAALGRDSTPQQRAEFRHRAHLDQPMVERYGRWLEGVVAHGDFGRSVISGEPVGAQLSQRTEYTAVLAALSLAIGVILALPLAVRAAQRPGGPFDIIVSGAAVGIVALPEFVLGILVLLVFAAELKLLPVIGSGLWESVILPSVTLGLGAAAYIFRIARGTIQDTLAAPYVRNAILRGFSRRRIIWRHVMPNAGIVVVNAIALNAIYLIGGVIVVESVFSYPGLGSLLVNAISQGDIVLIEAVGLIMAALFISINAVADGIVLVLNPKLRTR